MRRKGMHGEEPIVEFRIEIVVEPDDIGFHAYCPALKGLHTGGDTEEEAVQNAKDAAKAYLESSIKHGDPIPVGAILKEEVGEIPPPSRASRHTEDLKVVCAI